MHIVKFFTYSEYLLYEVNLIKLQFKLYSIALKLKQEMAIWNLSIV